MLQTPLMGFAKGSTHPPLADGLPRSEPHPRATAWPLSLEERAFPAAHLRCPVRASRRMAARLMVRDARLRGLLTLRVFLALRADLPPWQIKFLHSAAANQPDGQITSDFQK